MAHFLGVLEVQQVRAEVHRNANIRLTAELHQVGAGGSGKNGVTGVIVPLDGAIIDRVFHHRHIIPVFAETLPSDVEAGDRAFLYVTGGARVLDGEGGVSSVTQEPLRVVRDIGSELCLSSVELDDYAARSSKSEDDSMLVLKLEEPTKYVRPMKCSLKVPQDWMYMTAEVFFTILRENQ